MSIGLISLLQVARCLAQAPPQSLRLDQAVDLAINNYPAIRVARERAAAAAGGVELARTAYLPRTDLLWQENRATTNNVFGLLLPQAVIPAISGPVLGTKSFDNVWGSAGGVLLSWEIFDLGLRRANVALARAETSRANAGVEATRFEAATGAADAFLTVIAVDQTVKSAQANVERMETFSRSVHVLVDNQLRAGVDASRSDAELAAARIQLIQAQQNAELARATLAELLGIAGAAVSIDAAGLLEFGPQPPEASEKLESHPLALEQISAVEVARARERVIEKSYFPRFNFQTAFSGRGTGGLVSGKLDGTHGLLPETPNWASGLTITFSPMEIFSIRSRRKIEASNEAAEKAWLDQTLQSLKAQEARARVLADAARRIADTTPAQLAAAREAEFRTRARYDAQLGTVSEVAEAQRLLAQAEIDDSIARLGIWRAFLAAARARGDIKPFLAQVVTASQRRK